ncbi:hypothetical protein JOD62_002638 [Microbacterium keratanolyticum]|uniref:Uncharacterized protein n=1 Tax=Microbacterium keratanolyticum TaxID=67574 RepID=A0A9W6M9H6_9MICO|nr:hypothetical protein [Microbacterium keratanolyticum]MBM7470090.1 hypothetical protein [Microbacterium keratanolyticum]GLK02169.1 hypothetical protein GCM10017596_18840 [Microbacterium keratanolyticum]
MELWQRTREFGRGTEVPEDDIAKARGKLVAQTQGAAAPSRARSPRRPVWIGAGTLAGAAAVTVGVLLIAQNQSVPTLPEAIASPTPVVTPKPVPTPTPTPTAEPAQSTSSILAGAAQASLNVPERQPGQYLKIVDERTSMVFYSDEYGVSDLGSSRMNAESAWAYVSQSERYVPADLMSEWAYVQGGGALLDVYFGADAQVRAEEFWDEASGSYSPGAVSYWAGGGFILIGSWPTDGGDGSRGRLFQTMPTDPNEIMDWLMEIGVDPHKRAWLLTKLLAENVGSPAQRAGLYLALSTLPESQLVAYDDHRATIVSTSKYGADHADPSQWDTVTIDRATGYVLEYSIRRFSNPEFMSDDLPDEHHVYSLSVVDSAP